MIDGIIKKLTSIPSVSGFEHRASRLFTDSLKDICKVNIDEIGNGYAYLTVNNSLPTVLLIAHIDEIGFQVSYIDDNGFLFFRANGGVDPVLLPGSQVVIYPHAGLPTNGVIGRCPIHLLKTEERGKPIDIDSLWIDTGLPTETVKKMIHVGDSVSFAPNFHYLGDSRIVSKGLDNKVGVAIIATVIRNLTFNKDLRYNIVAVVSAQEELGARSAKAIVDYVNPDIVICLDMGFASDVPDISPRKVGAISLGSGPILTKNADSSQSIVELCEKLALDNHIPYQITVGNRPSGGTDASNIRIATTHTQSLLVSIPSRYMHSQVEMCDTNDIDGAIKLITCLLSNE